MDRSVDRRTYLATASAATALAIAGCTGADDSDEEGDGDGGGLPADYPDAAGTFDDFEDLDPWEEAVGSLSADGERSYAGSQSAMLSVDEDENHARITRELDEPTDFSAVVPAVAATADVDAAPTIQLLDEDEGRIAYRTEVSADGPFVRRNLGVGAIDGEPDRSAITEIQVIFHVGEDRTGRLWVDDLHMVPQPDGAQVMIHLDGGYESHHRIALPALEQYGFPATDFVPPGRIRESEEGEGTRLTEDQLAELADAGVTIGSYGMHGLNLTTLESREQSTEIADAAAWLDEEGYDAAYFAYPQGAYDGETLDLVAENHEFGFAGRFPAQGYASNPLLCQRVPVHGLGTARQAIDVTAEHGGITALTFYELRTGDAIEVFRETLEYLAERVDAGDVSVVDVGTMSEYVYED